MGYYSEVGSVIKIDIEHKLDVKSILEKELLIEEYSKYYEFLSFDITKENLYIIFHIDSIKWYAEDTDWYNNFTSIFKDFEPSIYFVRIGEDYSDIEEESSGDDPPYDKLIIIRSLDISDGKFNLSEFLKNGSKNLASIS